MIEYNPFSLEGKTILITGASSGIGRSTAIECSKLGANVIITGRNEQRLNETMYLMHGQGHHMYLCDLEVQKDICNLVSLLPKIDGLVNNAGITITKPVPFIDVISFNKILNVNTVSPLILLKNILKQKKLVLNSSVVFISSIAGLGKISFGNCMYAGSKGAICAMAQGLAKELANMKIRVNTVCPGIVDTCILDSSVISKEQLEKNKLEYVLKRYGKPEDIAWAIIYLLSDASSWVTGINLIIDGGRSLR